MVNWMWKSNSKQASKEEDEVNEEDLKKKGFDPESLEIGEAKE